MTRYPVTANGMPLLRWETDPARPGSAARSRAPRFAGPGSRSRGRLGALSEVGVGLLLLVGWVVLWAFLLNAVVRPADRLVRTATVEEHPSLGAGTAAPSTAGRPVSVDTAGSLP
jgi:hypothetical protein